jgi:hypothetical protein
MQGQSDENMRQAAYYYVNAVSELRAKLTKRA